MKDYENLNVTGINRMPARAYFVPYESEYAAGKGQSERYICLNGKWKYDYLESPCLFDIENYDCEDCFEKDINIPVSA
ncbi:MAG: hypothetical protein KBT47_03625, partial [Armatimonadetes bacterium]|nr:hypothetical protein [Candidatus Hippobium faecium]